jgi:hypothetical protein
LVAQDPKVAGSGQTTADVEGIVTGRVAGKETSRRSGRSKPLHLSFSSSDRHVRAFGPVVQPLAPMVDAGKAKVTKNGIVGAIPVSDDRRRHESLVLQQLAHQAQGCILVAPGLNEYVEDLAFIIDGAPQIHLPTGNCDEDFVEMPSPSRCRAHGPQATRIDRAEVDHLSADRLMGDGYSALREKILDVSEAEREAQIQPDGMLDDRWRESIAAVAERSHRRTLPTARRPGQGSPLDVTSPIGWLNEMTVQC